MVSKALENRNEGIINNQLEYALAMLGISAAILFFLFDKFSKFAYTDRLADFIALGLMVSCGALVFSIIYFSVFVFVYGISSIKLSEISRPKNMNILNNFIFYLRNIPYEFVLKIQKKRGLLNSAFINAMLFIFFSLFLVGVFIEIIFYVLIYLGTKIDLFTLLDKLDTNQKIIIVVSFILLFCFLRIDLSSKRKSKVFSIKLNNENGLNKLLFVVIILFVVVPVLYFIGTATYMMLGYPTIDTYLDSVQYTTCDSKLTIKTTAFALARTTENRPLKVLIISPTGNETYTNPIFLDLGTFISEYNLIDREEGVYKVISLSGTFRNEKRFILTNNVTC